MNRSHLLLFLAVLIASICLSCNKNPAEPKGEANVILEGEITVQEGFLSTVQYLGKVKNIGNREANSVLITFDTYDKNSKLVATNSGLTSPWSLDPGEIGSFDITAFIDYIDYGYYECRIHWEEY